MRGCGLIVDCELWTFLDAQHLLHTLEHAWKGLNSKHKVNEKNKYLKKSRHALVIVPFIVCLHLATFMLADNSKDKWQTGCSLLRGFHEGQMKLTWVYSEFLIYSTVVVLTLKLYVFICTFLLVPQTLQAFTKVYNRIPKNQVSKQDAFDGIFLK